MMTEVEGREKKMSESEIKIQVQETPNPYALKFIANRSLKDEGKATFHTKEEAEGLSLIESLFAIPGVVQVYLFKNTLTVTHDGSLDSQLVKDNVVSVLKTRLPIHEAGFVMPSEINDKPKPKKERSGLTDELMQIEDILDRTIRPGLQADGGDVEIISYENDELRILYQGACGGCPSAMMGTLDAIQSILRHELDNESLQVTPI